MEFRKILFRARRKDTGEYIEGAYIHITRKSNSHVIFDENNDMHDIYRESLEMFNEYLSSSNQWESI